MLRIGSEERFCRAMDAADHIAAAKALRKLGRAMGERSATLLEALSDSGLLADDDMAAIEEALSENA